MKNVQDALSKNRAEEIGYDVWEHFVIPPFFNLLDLHTARKPRIVIGGRGCGKTMLLRYFSHQTTFSTKRANIPDSAITHIGLYWRADTQFCSAMTKRGIDEDTWISAFNHFAALMLGAEILNSMQSVARSNFSKFDDQDLNQIDFSSLSAFMPDIPGDYTKLKSYFEQSLWRFEAWVNNVRKQPEPNFLPGRDFLIALITLLKRGSKALGDASFYVYLDEYENLQEYQQRVINTWLKHSEIPLIIHLAMKRNSFITTQTLGNESIADIHDLRQHDLEEYIHREDAFLSFAAEILFLQLSLVGYEEIPIDVSTLRQQESLSIREGRTYQSEIIKSAQQVFPDLSHEDMAQAVFADSGLHSKLTEKITTALKFRKSDLSSGGFLNKDFAQASIIVPALLYRKKLSPQEVLEEFLHLVNNQKNRFTGETEWIPNNFVGCLLQLYAPNSRPCPFYSGFKTFCKLSRGNLRHFLELCHKSLNRSVDVNGNLIQPVDVVKQAEAARQTSASFLGEIRSFGKYGNKLHTFVLRLGSLFALAHKRPTQSETEQSHFSIRSGKEELTDEDYDFLREATKWSVLFEYQDTKRKDEYQPNNVEYVLNPIYTPYFFISYRKKRRLEISTEEASCLMRGSLTQFTSLMRHYSKQWEVDTDDLEHPILALFD